MKSLLRLLKFAYDQFGPILVYYIVYKLYGARPAIVSSIVFSAFEVLQKWRGGKAFTTFFQFSVGMTLVFGALDLWGSRLLFLRYESAITNIITGIYFGMTARASKSFIQEWVEKKEGRPLTDPDGILRCRMLTLLWTLYFFAKATFYFYVSTRYSMEEALLIRSAVGSASFYALLGFSVFFGKRTLVYLQQRGLLPRAPSGPHISTDSPERLVP